jgi:N6-adenosine-specific RNA methylase IME4
MTTTKKRRPKGWCGDLPARAATTAYDDPDLPSVLLADPPWQHDDTLGDRGALAHYRTMPTKDICALPLPKMAARRVLCMWKLANMPQDALDVVRAWGFLPLAEVVWEKLRPCSTCCATGRVDVHRFGDADPVFVPGTDNRCPACRGRRGEEIQDEDIGTVPGWMGLGTTVRNAHETLIIARPIDGQAPPRVNLDVRSYFAAPMLLDVDGILPESNGRRGTLVHSAKPDEVYRLIERLYPGPFVEMFGRRPRVGWRLEHSDEDRKLVEVVRIMREDWPRRTREELLAKARKTWEAARP